MCSADQADPTVRQVNAYGVFESYYDTSRLERENNSVVALIGALQLFLLYGLGPFFGKIFDSYGVVVRGPPLHLCVCERLVLTHSRSPARCSSQWAPSASSLRR